MILCGLLSRLVGTLAVSPELRAGSSFPSTTEEVETWFKPFEIRSVHCVPQHHTRSRNNLYRQGNVKLAHKGSMERLTGKNRHLYQQQIQETNMLLKFTLGLRERWLDRKSASPPSLMTSVQSPGMTGRKGKTLLLGVLWPSHTHHDILCTQTQNKCWFCGFCFLC